MMKNTKASSSLLIFSLALSSFFVFNSVIAIGVVDSTPPSIISSDPIDSSTNVSIGVQPKLTFSEPLDPATVTGNNIELREYATLATDAKKVPTAITYSAENIVTFILSSALEYNKQYYFFVGTGVTDIAGNKFVASTWYHAQRADHEFTTETLPVNLSSIAIITPATKLSYIVGDTLDIAGLVVEGTYSDISTSTLPIVVTDVTGFDSSVPVTGQVLIIKYEGKITTYTVDIIAVPVEATTTPPVIDPIIPPIVVASSGGGTGYLPGWGPDGLVGTTTVGQVLGTSTSRYADLVRQRRLNYFRRRLLQIKYELLLLEHSELRGLSGGVGTSTSTTTPIPATTTTASTTTDTKPFWRFW